MAGKIPTVLHKTVYAIASITEDDLHDPAEVHKRHGIELIGARHHCDQVTKRPRNLPVATYPPEKR